MELRETIFNRRSVRRYKRTPVPREIIDELLEAAIQAPSAGFRQQWYFTVLSGVSKKKFNDFFQSTIENIIKDKGRTVVSTALASSHIMYEAPIIILVWNTSDYGWMTDEHSVAAAIQNLMLQAHELGLGTLWVGDVYYGLEEIKKFYGKDWILSAAVCVGYPEGVSKKPSRKMVSEVAEFLT